VDDSLTLLVDAPSLFYRALYSTPDSVKAPDGTPMNAAHGFFRMLARLVVDHDPDYIACASDDDWRPQWRVDLIPSYKSHRAESGSQQEQAEVKLAPQVPVIYGFLEAMGLSVVGHDGYEAEDIIGTLAARAPGRVGIFSGDRDLFQLVEDPKCFVIYPVRGVSVVNLIDESYITEKYGIPGRSYRDFAVLRGDPSDGLPGVRGIGEKLAKSLVARYGTIEGIVEAARVSEGKEVLRKVMRDLDYVQRAYEVVSIPRDLPLPPLDLTRPRRVPETELLAAAKGLGLGNPVESLIKALEGPQTATS
jgi:5'-3' exonuclease